MRGLPHVTVVLWILEIVAVICPGGAPGASGDPVAPERPRLSTSRKAFSKPSFSQLSANLSVFSTRLR
jgi:hypothetical protein